MPRPGWTSLKSALLNQRPADVLQVIHLIAAADAEDPASRPDLDASPQRPSDVEVLAEFQRRVRAVIRARSNWHQELLAWHTKKECSAFQRNFLLAAALLRGAKIGHVYAAAAELCAKFGDGDIDVVGQSAPGVHELLQAIEASLRTDSTVSFPRPAWEDAVVEYFWTDRPLSRKLFLKWLAEAPKAALDESLEQPKEADRQAMATRVAGFAVRWAVRLRRKDPLAFIAGAWRNDKALWPKLVEVLDAAATEHASSRYIHELLLDWAKSSKPEMQLAAVQVCARNFGRAHTGKAVRRLQHAAASTDSGVRHALREAVLSLWDDQSVRTILFGHIAAWCRGEQVESGRRCFAVLAAQSLPAAPRLPLLLAEQEDFKVTQATLAVGWRAVLAFDNESREDEQSAKAAVELWLDAAVAYPAHRLLVLQSLQQAVGNDEGSGLTSRRDRLRKIAREWTRLDPPDSESRSILYTELSKLIDDTLVAAFREDQLQSSPTAAVAA